jgi:hypothetical protein
MAGTASFARPARHVVHDRDAAAVLEHALDLVAEHRARRRMTDLLDVRAAQPARMHAHEQPGAGRDGHIDELRQPVRV